MLHHIPKAPSALWRSVNHTLYKCLLNYSSEATDGTLNGVFAMELPSAVFSYTLCLATAVFALVMLLTAVAVRLPPVPALLNHLHKKGTNRLKVTFHLASHSSREYL